MPDKQQSLRIAVGLTRRAISMFDNAGRPASGARLAEVVEEILEANPWLRESEMSPEVACLAMGIPLTREDSPALAEIDPPADLVLPSAPAGRPSLVWPPSG